MVPLWIGLVFVVALGACVGSFLNVVVWRLPRVEIPDGSGPARGVWLQFKGLSYPPSHCPKCGYVLRWYDNLPVVGWIRLRGRCRSCRQAISPRYPLVEAFTAGLFGVTYAAFFLAGPQWGPPTPTQRAVVEVPTARLPAVLPGETADPRTLAAAVPRSALPRDAVIVDARQIGPRGVGVAGVVGVEVVYRRDASPTRHWPQLAVVLVLASCLIAASLIDAELFLIPRVLSYLPAAVAVPVHALAADPGGPLDLSVGPVGAGWAVGLGIGLAVSMGLLATGRMKRSFAEDVPMLEHERAAAGTPEPTADERRAEAKWVRREMLREVAFLAPPVLLGLTLAVLAWRGGWTGDLPTPLAAGLGSLLGGFVGAGVIWVVRIAGSLAFGREAMGLGDVDLMFGVGCVLGPAVAGIALFPAAVLGLAYAVFALAARGSRELPFGPYLAAASILLIFLANPLADYARPSLEALSWIIGPAGALFGLPADVR